jgi:glycosyltransferase involved in cell wall biosynthesis
MLERTRSGFYARDSRPEAIAEAIRYLRDHPQECEMMGARARELAVQEYARPKQTATFEQVLLEACERHHAGSSVARARPPLGKAEPRQSQ